MDVVVVVVAKTVHSKIHKKRKKKRYPDGYLVFETGNDIFSRLASKQVSSALKALTSVFGMRTGVAPSLISPVMVKCL